ncbi:MAG: glycosyltransferase family 2 protein [Anaerolineae bacterium]|nr:glycosyltransferase family 2 protein [Anaerolineae bacterium]
MINTSELGYNGVRFDYPNTNTASNATAQSATWLPSVSVVIPTLNEAQNLPFVLPRLPEMVTEVILVDGRSTDNTIEVARQLRPDVKVVMETRRGKGVALRTGFEAATGDIIVMIDGDGSTDPEEIPSYVGALLAGADFAKGSRFLQGGGTSDMEFYRRLGNWGFVMMVRFLFGGKYSDLCYGYNAFWKHSLPLLSLDGDGFEIETMMNVRALQAGLIVTEVPSFEFTRIHGNSNLRTIPDGLRVLKTIFKEWRRKPNVRAIPQNEHMKKDSFVAATRLLFREALHLSQKRDQLSQQAYERGLDALKETYKALLNMELSSPSTKQIQERYQRYYSDDSLWHFMEQN